MKQTEERAKDPGKLREITGLTQARARTPLKLRLSHIRGLAPYYQPTPNTLAKGPLEKRDTYSEDPKRGQRE